MWVVFKWQPFCHGHHWVSLTLTGMIIASIPTLPDFPGVSDIQTESPGLPYGSPNPQSQGKAVLAFFMGTFWNIWCFHVAKYKELYFQQFFFKVKMVKLGISRILIFFRSVICKYFQMTSWLLFSWTFPNNNIFSFVKWVVFLWRRFRMPMWLPWKHSIVILMLSPLITCKIIFIFIAKETQSPPLP